MRLKTISSIFVAISFSILGILTPNNPSPKQLSESNNFEKNSILGELTCTPGTNLVVNGNFQSGNLNGWAVEGVYDSGVSACSDGIKKGFDAYSDQSLALQSQNIDSGVDPNKNYGFSFVGRTHNFFNKNTIIGSPALFTNDAFNTKISYYKQGEVIKSNFIPFDFYHNLIKRIAPFSIFKSKEKENKNFLNENSAISIVQNENYNLLDNNYLLMDDCCDTGDNPVSFTLTYNGANCGNSNNSQGTIGDKWDCVDSNGGPNADAQVYITTNDGFSGTVNINSEFEVSNGGSSLSNPIEFFIYDQQGGTLLQYIEIHTSCSVPIVIGDQFGSLVLEYIVFADGSDCGFPPCSGAVIDGDADICPGSSTMLTAQMVGGEPPFQYNWSTGSSNESITVSPSTSTNYSVTITDAENCVQNTSVTVSIYEEVGAGSISGDEANCGEFDPSIINNDQSATGSDCGDPSDLGFNVCPSDGNPDIYIYEYTGGSCSESVNTQLDLSEGKWSCSESNGGLTSGQVYITGSGPDLPGYFNIGDLFETTGGSFDILTGPGGQLLQEIAIHTSCSVPITIGDSFGGLTLVGASYSDGTVYGGDPGLQYQWQQRTSGGSWQDISGADEATYDPGTITETTEYRREAINCCGVDYSNVVTKTVNPIVEVSAGSDVEVCDQNAIVTATTIGGTSPFTFNWSNGQSGATLNVSSSGIYSVTVMDANNCTDEATVRVDVYDSPTGGSISGNEAFCDSFDPSMISNVQMATGSDCGDPSDFGYDVCTGPGNPDIYIYQYTGGSCAESVNTQLDLSEGKWSCSESNGGLTSGQVYLTGSGPDLPSYFNIGDLFETTGGSFDILTAPGGQLLQEISIHTSCSVPITIGDSFGGLTLVGASYNDGTIYGGDPGLQYQWQQRTSGGAWQDIAGADEATYDPGTITETTEYRREAINCCGSDFSNVVTKTINTPPTIDVIGNTNICVGESTTLSVSINGNGPFSYSWSTGATSSSITVSPNGKESYYVTVEDVNGCTISDYIIINPAALASPGSIGFDEVECGPFDPNIINSIEEATSSTINYVDGEQCCTEGDDVKGWTFLYTGESCDATNTSQNPSKYSCTGDAKYDNEVYIVVNDEGGTVLSGEVYFTGTVSLGEEFTALASNAGKSDFQNEVYFHIFDQQGGQQIQLIQIFSNCSEPVVTGDQFGSLILLSATHKNLFVCGLDDGNQNIEYKWQKRNGTSGPWSDISGATSSTYDPPFMTSNMCFRRLARVNGCDWEATESICKEIVPLETPGSISGDEAECGCYDPDIITSVSEADGGDNAFQSGLSCCNEGDKPVSFTLLYNGENCGNSSNAQGTIGSKWDCADFNGGPSGDNQVFITTNDDPVGTVVIDEAFEITNGGGSLSNPIVISIYDFDGGDLLQTVEIHTSCSAPIVTGDQFGSLVLLTATFDNGYQCGDFLPLEYQWEQMTASGSWEEITTGGLQSVTISSSIQTSSDDVEEEGPDSDNIPGRIYRTSTDLEITEDFDPTSFGTQKIGLRFTGLNLPQGATITNAYIRFRAVSADDPNTNNNIANLTIYGGDEDNVATFSTTPFEITNKAKTSASVAWNPTSWSAGSDYNSATISSVVQEIVNRGGWTPGNSMAFYIVGTGSRSAESYDNSGTNPPELVVEYEAVIQNPVTSLEYDPPLICETTKYRRKARVQGCDWDYSNVVTKTVYPIPEVDIQPVGTICLLDGEIQLSATPSGGTFIGTGVSASGLFDPQVTGPGSHEITYEYTDGNGCFNSDIITIDVEGTATVGDYVWEDIDADGVQDAGEPGIDGVTVELRDASDNSLVDQTTTAGGGFYKFTTCPGTYYIKFGAYTDFERTTQNGSISTTDNSDANVVDGTTSNFTLNENDNIEYVDAGYYEPASLGDFVWLDIDADGIQDGGEPGIANVTVNLYADANQDGVPDGAALNTTSTDGTGFYDFTGLAPGDYVVEFVAPTGFLPSPQNQGGDDAVDSDAAPGTGLSQSVNLESGENDPTIDAGYYESAFIGDYVWEDTNGDGIQDAGEPGIPGVTVNLYEDNNEDGLPDGGPIATDVTDGNGEYGFPVDPGSYIVEFVTPGGFDPTDANQGGDDTVDSDAGAGGLTGTITVGSGETDLTNDAGYYEPASLGDFVWLDIDADGIQDGGEPGIANVTVNLYADANQDGVPDGAALNTTSTDGTGFYDFTGLAPGDYVVEFVAPTGFLPSPQNQGGDDAVDSDAAPGTGLSQSVNLESGENDPTIDAGYYESAFIGDYVWEDTNGDGIQDAGEPGIPGVTVNLYEDNNEDGLPDGGPIATDVTDGNGEYGFPVDPGSYIVEFVTPGGFDPTDANQGGDDTVDSDAGAGGLTGTITVGSGETDLTNDAGYYEPASLGDFVWLDIDADGIQDGGEPGIANVTVNLYADANQDGVPDGAALNTTSTDGTGFYDFTGLAPGDYVVEFVAPTGFLPSPQNQGGDDAVDSDAAPGTGLSQSVNLESGENDPTIDAGYYESAFIGDYVWEDTNGDGIQDAGEPGIPGVTVNLYEDNNEDGLPDGGPIATDVTDGNGEYGFPVDPGSYIVEFVTPGGFDPTDANQGGDDTVDSDAGAGGLTGTITVGSGETDLTNDAGYYEPASLGDFVWLDIDADGIQDGGEPGIANVTVNLYADANQDGVPDGAALNTTSTDGTGFYDFTGLAPGDYVVEFVAPTGFLPSPQNQGGDDAVDSDAAPGTGLSQSVNLESGENDPTIDAGYYESAFIGDYVWEDTNGDGIQDAGEPGIPGVTVNLYEDNNEDGLPDGGPIATDVTDGNGEYGFPVDPGSYIVEFVTPGGFDPTDANQGGDDTVDSDAGAGGLTGTITVGSGETDLTNDAGYYEPASLGDFVWLDIDADGIQDGGEPGIANVTVNLYADANQDGVPDGAALNTTSTDGTGFYDFTGLAPGDYVVEFVAPTGFLPSPQNQGGDDAVDSDAAPGTGLSQSVNLESGENDPTIDAGYYESAFIGDYVWEDTNGDGIQDAGEPGIPGVTVNLYEDNNEDGLPDGGPIATDVTDGNGEYGFPVDPGSYIVEFVTPGGFDPTDANQGGDDTVDSDAGAGGLTGTITVGSGETDLTNDAGYYEPASLGDFVWLDIDADGIQDGGEPGIANVTVNLYADANQDGVPDGAALNTTSTDGTGFYDFTGLAPGDYVVEFVAPTGFLPSPQNQGGDDAVDSDAAPGTGLSQSVNLESGENDPTIDAGYYESAFIGDYVWEDTNGDGIQDAGEPGIPGVTVNLYEDNNEDGLPDGGPIATDVTDGNGEYGFPVDPGSYIVEFVTPGGFDPTDANQGGDDTVDSDAGAGGLTGTITVGSGETDLTNDAGYYEPASLGDFVWLDTDADGIQDGGELGINGVTVVLLNGDGTPTGLGTVTANNGLQDGYYEFTNLVPGDYIVEFGTLTGYYRSPEGPGVDDIVANDSDADVSSGKSNIVTLSSGDNEPDIDAGLFEPASIGDTVWFDLNANGLYDSGESGLAGIAVTLLDGNDNPVTFDAAGNTITTITTGTDGFYQFTNLIPGDYKVQFGTSTEHFRTIANAGDDTKDSDADETSGITPIYTLTAGEYNSTVDAGYICKVIINGQVFYDRDGLFDGEVDGTGMIPPGMYAALLNVSGGTPIVEDAVSIPHFQDPNPGVFELTGLPFEDYVVVLVNNLLTKGDTYSPISSTLPPNYGHTGDFVGTGPGGDYNGRDGITTEFTTQCEEIFVKFGIVKAFTFTID